MKIKSLLFIALLFSAVNSFAQKNLKYTPEHPKAGEAITITYTAANDLMGTKATVEGVVYTMGSKLTNAHDIVLKKSGNAYVGTVQTDTSDNFVFFGFSADGTFDKANNEGFWIQLYEGDKIKKGANLSLSTFYNGYNGAVGIEEGNKEKSFAAMQDEFKLYPETKGENLIRYLQAVTQNKKEEAPSLIQKEIEEFVKKGLKTESDYSTLRTLYSLAKLPAQSAFINGVLKEKFPEGKWTVNETANKYMAEKDLDKKEKMLDDIIKNLNSNPDWKEMKQSEPFFISNLANAYAAKNDFDGMKRIVQKYDIKGADLAQMYNSIAWKLQEKDENLKLADELSENATNWTKNEWKNPAGNKPPTQNETAWEKSRANTYAMYADTYAMVQYKLGNYKKGFPYTEDAFKITKGQDADQNNTYALLASKVLPAKKYVPQLEKFVIDGKATPEIKDILKTSFTGKNGAEGFDAYLAKLEKESYLKMLAELKKSMLDESAPHFSLVDLDGKKVNLADLKNKVVIVDFWATWCGPCIASFPGMQKMVTKYKDDPEVKFVFIDTWENGDNKEKEAKDFMAKYKYDFHVLMDNDSKVVESFKVSGIPTKFVVDKNGITRFKSVGYGGSVDKLVSELTAMIDMAKGK